MPKTEFIPLRDRIVVRVVEPDKYHGKIIIPEQYQKKPQIGDVIAVGEGYIDEEGKTVPLHVKPGMRVLFGKYTGTDINVDGEELIIFREEDVLGIILEVAR